MKRTTMGSGLAAAAALVVAAATPAFAADRDAETGWLPWLGCWQPVAAVGVDTPTVCFVATGDAATVEVITIEAGEIVSRDRLTADGAPRSIDEGGCVGSETASWSADGRRVYLGSELSCEGVPRRMTGLLALASPIEWLEIQVVGAANVAGDEKGVRVVRYRATSGAALAAHGIVAVPAERALAAETARHAAAAPITVAAVQEAITQVDAEVVEVWMIEREARFALSAQRLIELHDAGVPESVIDLMVALSNPQRFAIDRNARIGEMLAPQRTARPERDRYGYTRFGTFGRYPYWGWNPYSVRYGYGPYSYSPYGWGWGSYYTGQPVIVIVRPGSGEGRVPLRAVRGRGYSSGGTATGTSSAPRTERSTGTASGASSSGSSSSGSAARGSSGSGATDTGRTAKPRGNNN
jgi:hypothetical protein